MSIYDVVLPTPIPDDGKILTQLSLWWFGQLADIVPNHVISASDVPPEWAGRAIRCRRLEMIPMECIVRGYLAGLGLASYQKSGSISGVPAPSSGPRPVAVDAPHRCGGIFPRRDATIRAGRVASGDNPLTGPFLVDGAQPGDTLAVQLRNLAPNRNYGYSETSIMPGVVDPACSRELPPRSRAIWQIDSRTDTAWLSDPVAVRPISVRLRPMLGCLGVAPSHGQVIWSGTSGRHGGNMDYRGVSSGVTVYFPVFVPGALLYLQHSATS